MLLWLLVLSGVLAPRAVRAEGELGSVLIVRVARDAAVVARIRAELEANDWNVREIGPDPASARGSLSQLAASSRARAALRMQPERGAIELWVSGQGDAAGSGEVLVVPRDERDDAVLALRATEALRARGLRLQRRSEPEDGTPVSGTAPASGTALASGTPASAAQPGEPRSLVASPPAASEPHQAPARAEPRSQPSAAEQAPATPKPKPGREPRPERTSRDAEPASDDLAAQSGRDDEPEEEPDEPEPEPVEPGRRDDPMLLSVELAPGLVASLGGVSLSWIGWLNVRVQPHDRWSLNVLGFAPFAGGTLELEAQRAQIWSYLAGGSLDVHWPGRSVDLTAGAGAAFMLTWMQGVDALETNTTRDELVPTGALLARAGVHVPLTRQVAVVGRMLVGMSIPRLTVKFAGDTAGHAGQPFFVGTVGVDVSLF